MEPVVSVIIPAYNRARVIGRAIESALSQTLSDIEIIVIDDASTDELEKIVQSYQDSRVQYIRHKTNQFAAAARNSGMQIARAKYIAFLDSDDEWLPNKLETQVAVLEHCGSEWGCVYSGANIFKNDERKQVVTAPSKDGMVLKEYLINQIVICTPTFLFRRSCLRDVGYMDVSLVRCEDRDFYIRMLKKYKLAVVREPLTNVFLDTKKPLADISLQSRLKLLEKHDAILDELGWATKRHAYGIQWALQAEQYFVERRQGLGINYMFKSLFCYPFLSPNRYLSLVYKFAVSLVSR